MYIILFNLKIFGSNIYDAGPDLAGGWIGGARLEFGLINNARQLSRSIVGIYH